MNDCLENEWASLCDRMNAVIKSARKDQKPFVTRYLSLANRKLTKIFDKTGSWGVIGASCSIRENYERKFGPFVPMGNCVFQKEFE